MTNPYPGNTNWPAEFNGSRIQGKWVGLDGTPVSGSVTFSVTPSALVAKTSKTIIVPRPLTVVLDATGSIDIVIPASDDPDIFPYGSSYTVKENWSGGLTYQLFATVDGVENLADLKGQSAFVPPEGYPGFVWAITRGEARSWDVPVTYLDGTPVETGVLTNPRSEWRSGLSDTSPVEAVFNTSTVCPIVGSASVSGNILTFSLSATASAQLTVGGYYFDIWADSGGNALKLKSGLVNVLQNTTALA